MIEFGPLISRWFRGPSAGCAGALVFGAFVLVAPAAMASDAETLFREGRKAIQAGDYPTGCAKFAESEKLEPAPGTLLNLADCEEHLGRFSKSAEHYRLAASGFPKNDPRRKLAMERAQTLDARVGRLTLKLGNVPPGTVVRRDGADLPTSALGREEPADPGDVEIVVVASGRRDRSYKVHVDEGKPTIVVLEAGEPIPAPAARDDRVVKPVVGPSDADVRSARTRRTVGYALAGVGVASLAVGAVTGILALDRAATVDEHCDADVRCDQEGLDAAESGEVLAPVSTVTIAAGVLLVGAGVYFLLTSKPPRTGQSPVASGTLGGLGATDRSNPPGRGFVVLRF